MEQATNSFQKGLLSDTHPMVQSNDTLSSALNGTFVTMNGNEVILLNDMGNRRVDNAFLPNGYEPVGMKEYGGIIYIAAYNPITNRSQIGSFPSPERRISSNDSENLGNTLDLTTSFTTARNDYLEGLNCLVNDTVLVPLTKDTSLHAGDKFIVYLKNSSSFGVDPTDKITNYKNVNSIKVLSPKNKQYTLALGILNSQNEFVDITSSLVRWDNNNIMNLEDKTDLYKFNAGYFIKKGVPETSSSELKTINDAILEGEREHAYQIMKANTYSYKLVGPLYIKATYNHISDFSYNIYGTYNGTNAELFVEGFITYNCPDGITSGGRSDSNYNSYAEGLLNNSFGYDFLINNQIRPIADPQLDHIPNPITTYDPNTNLYTVKVVKKYNVPCGPTALINYVIGVKANNESNNEETVYLSGLSAKGTIDVAKLGSGLVEMLGYRFTNNYSTRTGTITYTIDAYPKYNEEFRNFRLIFTNVIGNNEVTIPAQLNNGKTNLRVSWSEEEEGAADTLWNRALYQVDFVYDIYNKTTGQLLDTISNAEKKDGVPGNTDNKNLIKKEFYLTTELFNSCYSPSNSDYIPNYGYPIKDNEGKYSLFIGTFNPSDLSNSKREEEIIKRKLTIVPDATISYKLQDTPIDEKTEGSLIAKNKADNTITTTYTKDIKVTFTGELNVNKNLYPSYIQFTDDLTNVMLFDSIKSNVLGDLSEKVPLNASETVDNSNTEKLTYKSSLKWKDSITIKESDLTEYTGSFTNVFDSFGKYLNETDVSNYLSYSGILLESTGVTGALDHHGIYININRDNCMGSNSPEDGLYGEMQLVFLKSDLGESSSKWHEAETKFKASKYNIQSYYENINPGKVFAILGLDEGNEFVAAICRNNPKEGEVPVSFERNTDLLNGPNVYTATKYSRLLWKSTTGWAYVDFDTPITYQLYNQPSQDQDSGKRGNNIFANDAVKSYLATITIFNNLYYRRYKTLDSSGHTLYMSKNKLDYEPLSEIYKLTYKIGFSQNSNYITGLLDGGTILNFVVNDSTIKEEKTSDIFTLTSGEKFLDLITSEPKFSNFILDDFTMFDAKGEELSINDVYYKKTDGKYYKSNNLIPVRVEISDDNETFLVCVSEKSSLKLRCDFAEYDDEDSHTWINYDLVEKIDLDNIKNKADFIV